MTVHSPDTVLIINGQYSQSRNPTSTTQSRRGVPETELMDISIMDDLLNVINVLKEELSSDFDSWAQIMLGHGKITFDFSSHPHE